MFKAGSLQAHISKWIDINTSNYELNILTKGVKFPFVTVPNYV